MSGAGQQQVWLLAQSGNVGALVTFFFYTVAVFVLAGLSNYLFRNKDFLSEYFLGSRSLGVWAFALTFAATSASGGSFMGFPAKIYTHGWVLALWIASYMVVPICAIGLLAKRINQVARISGAITVPDVLRDRFRSVPLGLLATLLIVFFMAVNLVGQFKAGSVILQTLLRDVELFQTAAAALGNVTGRVGLFEGVNPGYLLCLFSFGVAVVVYTTYGGFRAVVWTDVMQGLVMVAGVLVMLPLALYHVGGLERATRKLAEMTPPRLGTIKVSLDSAGEFTIIMPGGKWLALPADDTSQNGAPLRLFRVTRATALQKSLLTDPPTPSELAHWSADVDVVELTTSGEIIDQLERLRAEFIQQSRNARTIHLEQNNPSGLEKVDNWLELATSDRYLEDLTWLNKTWQLSEPNTTGYTYGDGRAGTYVTGPGPNNESNTDGQREAGGFLPLSLAIAFFFMWAISGAGQPQYMVRLMAFNTSRTLARSIFTVSIYYSAIYFPLVIIFCCARVLLPGREGTPDEIMPQMAVFLTREVGHGWLAGLLIAAPFAAVMSTVDSFLLLVSSALVRDVYQRNINPRASEALIKRLCYIVTLAVGVAAMLGAINPPQFLQDIIVYTGSGLAACFLSPMVYALYWPRANAAGSIAGMAVGFLAHLAMYVAGYFVNGDFFTPYQILGFDPIIFGLLASFVAGYLGSALTASPPADLVRKFFYRGA